MRRLVVLVVVTLLLGVAVLWRWSRDEGLEQDAARDADSTLDLARDPASPQRVGRRAVRDGTATGDASPDPAVPDGPAAPEGRTGIDVTVVDDDGVRVSSGIVTFELADLHQFSKEPAVRFLAEITRDGVYGLARANPVRVRSDLALHDVRVRVIVRHPLLPPPEPVVVTLRADAVESVKVVVSRTRSVRVHVTSLRDRRGVAGARVTSANEAQRLREDERSGAGRATTDADGRATLTGLGAGAHRIDVHAPGHRRNSVTWNGERDLAIRLEAAEGDGDVVVMVRGPDGVVVEGMRVHALETDLSARTDGAGEAHFTALPTGTTWFLLDTIAWHDAFGSTVRDRDVKHVESVDVRPGTSARVELGFVRGDATLTVRVVREDGTPVPGVAVDCDERQSAITDEGGAARFRDLPPGDTSVWLRVGDDVTWRVDAPTASSGVAADARFVVGPHVIRGRVTGPDGLPLPKTTVSVRGRAAGWTRTDDDGRFAVPFARSGEYSVHSMHELGSSEHALVTVPSESVVELRVVEFGRVALRFLPADRLLLGAARFRLRRDHGFPAGYTPDAGSRDDDLVVDRAFPGAYHLEIELDGRTSRTPVAVKSGDTTVVEVRAP